jgi:hypothetical protein
VRRLAPLALAAALAAAGCGPGETKGTAAVWITRDRGAYVLRVARVPAGLTAMQALRRVADVKTRYGGRFVQAIDGLEGSLSSRRDWFYFVNGYEADRGAAEYRLHPGDVEWWDYRSWTGGAIHVPVVVGSFPEPFLHGYAGKRLPAFVAGRDRAAARAVAKRLHARAVSTASIPAKSNLLVLRRGSTSFTAKGGATPGAPVLFTYTGDWHALLRGIYRYRYSVP